MVLKILIKRKPGYLIRVFLLLLINIITIFFSNGLEPIFRHHNHDEPNDHEPKNNLDAEVLPNSRRYIHMCLHEESTLHQPIHGQDLVLVALLQPYM